MDRFIGKRSKVYMDGKLLGITTLMKGDIPELDKDPQMVFVHSFNTDKIKKAFMEYCNKNKDDQSDLNDLSEERIKLEWNNFFKYLLRTK